MTDDPDTAADSRPIRRGPFGLRRHHYYIIRVVLLVGIVVLGLTLHHQGAVYDTIRGVYFCLIVAVVIWRLNARRRRRF